MNLKILVLLLVALGAVSTSSIMARFLPGVPAIAIAFWRMTIGSGLLWGYSFLKPQGTIAGTSRCNILLAGGLLGLHFACFFGAVKLTTIANATLFATLAPVFTVLIEKIWFQRPWDRFILGGLGIALLGALLVNGGNFNLTGQHTLGIGLALLSSLWIALVFIIAEGVRQTTLTLVYSRTLYLVAGLTLSLLAWTTNTPLLDVNTQDMMWLFLLGLVPTILGHTVLSYTVKFIRPTVVAAVPLGEPILASVMALLIFREAIPFHVAAGGLAILVGLYLIVVHHKASQTPAPTTL
jgi:drug/metabolite transporter (DMT)-like permease